VEISSSFIFIIIFILLSAFFSGSETAFFSLSKIQLKKLEKSKSKKAKRIFRLLKKPHQLLIIILLGNTIVNVAASSIAALVAIVIGENLFPKTSTIIVIIFEIILMTFLLLIFGEITPKLIAFSSPEKFAGFSSFFIIILGYVLWPIIKILEQISALFTSRKSHQIHENLTSEDFKNLFTSKATQDSLEEKEKKMIAGILRFSSTSAKEIMVPRVDIVAVDSAAGISELKEKIIESGYSRIPIFKKNIDNIIGFVYAKDILLNPEKKTIHSLLRPALFVTENINIQKLLNQFKTKKIQIAIVVDEYGGTSGLLTLEDILEELVGEIMDEYDQEFPPLSKISDTEFLISGMFSIAELNHEFELNIDEESYDNLAEFLYDNFNKVPKLNDCFIFENKVKFVVTNIKAQRINYARMTFLNKPDELQN